MSGGQKIRIAVDCDAEADRATAILEALGYTVVRELEEGDVVQRWRAATS